MADGYRRGGSKSDDWSRDRRDGGRDRSDGGWGRDRDKGNGRWGDNRGWSDNKAWSDDRSWNDNKGKSGGGGTSAKVEEDTSRDWECEKCQTRNFAKRAECFKCKTPKPRPPEPEAVDPRADRERKLKAAIAMGIDPSMAETVIMDPRFADSIAQYEKMQKTQEEQQNALQQQQQQAPQAVPDTHQLMQMAMAQGYTAEQATQFVMQYMQQHQAAQAQGQTQKQQQQTQQQPSEQPQQQKQELTAPAEAAVPAAPDPAQLIAAAMAQGYTAEQAQLYAQQYMQQHQAQVQAAQEQVAAAQVQAQPQAQAQSAPEKQAAPAEKESPKVALYTNVPLILNMEESSRGEYRSTLKAVIVDQAAGGRRTFEDIFIKGPWRRRRDAALKDQEELSTAFKFDGKKGAEKRLRELEDTTWSREDLESMGGAPPAALEEDDFDAEADSDAAPEEELLYNHEELPVKVGGLSQFDGPLQTWEEGVARGCIFPTVCQALYSMQLQRPTLIQRFALPLIARTDNDLLAQAQTGSGKTFAFVIPIVSRLLANPPVARPFFPGAMAQASPIALLLSPTRELAIQTSQNVSLLFQHAQSTMTVMPLYGGETLSVQVRPIEKQNQDIICATPGRLIDAIDQGKVSLMFVATVVLDEADQMLDIAVGLEKTVNHVIDCRDLPKNDGRQTLLFSATMPDFQTKQFHAVLKAPPNRFKLRVGHYTEDEKGGSCRHIEQHLVRVYDMDERWRRLGRDLMEYWGSTAERRCGKGIVFTNRIAMAGPLEQTLRRCGISCGQLHGKQTQDVREDVVKRFRTGEYEMLIASNVASRGLDFPDIRIVVQFELPKTVEIYTHRIGRTGRNGLSGMALSYFWQTADWRLSKRLTEFLRLNFQAVPTWLDDMANGVRDDGTSWGGGGRRSRSPRRR